MKKRSIVATIKRVVLESSNDLEDLVGGKKMSTADQEDADDEMRYEINAHRKANGHPKIHISTPRHELKRHMDLINKHAPYGNDPWLHESSNDLEDLIRGPVPIHRPARDNLWDLYDLPGRADANDHLDAAWDHAKNNLSPDDAIRHMHSIMDKHRKLGASDSEGHAELAKRVQDHFGTDQHFRKARYRDFKP